MTFKPTRESGENPRALGTNPRAAGTNPRAGAENKHALRRWKRAQTGKPVLSKREQAAFNRKKAAKEREAERAAKRAAKDAIAVAKRQQEIDAMNARLDRMRRNELVRDIRRARMNEAIERGSVRAFQGAL